MSLRSTVVAALATVVEWYEFTLYLYFSAVLARVFFEIGPQSMKEMLGHFAIAYLMRPVGRYFWSFWRPAGPADNDAGFGRFDDLRNACNRNAPYFFSDRPACRFGVDHTTLLNVISAARSQCLKN